MFNGKTIAIDTSAPTTTITAVEYTDSGDGLAGTLVLTGDNFTGTNGLGVTQGNDAKSYLNWDNFVWQVKDGSGVTSSVTFNPETEVTSAIVTNNTTMTITLDAAANTALKGTENFAAQGAADSVAITAGFIKDISGNVSTTDAATLAPDYADATRPTVTSFTTTTPTGSYGVGAEIVITATTSEAIGKGGTITATFGFGGTVTLTADAAGTSLTGTYTVPSGVSTTALTISSFTTTAADLYGNTLQTTVPTGSVFNGKTIAIDTSAPTTTITAVEYTDSGDGLAGTLVLTGDNFTGTNGLGVTQGNDAKSYLNWDNFVWQVKDGSGVTSSVTFNPETEVTSAIVTNNTTMTITLDAAANTALKGTENFAAQGAADSVAITAGFIKDVCRQRLNN